MLNEELMVVIPGGMVGFHKMNSKIQNKDRVDCFFFFDFRGIERIRAPGKILISLSNC